MKIVITGGHTSPALALIDTILAQNQHSVSIEFIGRKFTSSDEDKPSWEYQEITRRKIPFHNLEAGRLTRSLSLQSFAHILKSPFGLFSAYQILRKTRPDSVMSFGGYIALPVCISAILQRIPYYSHEQTIEPGLTNKMLSKFAKKMFVAFPETEHFFEKNKTIVSGNLLRSSIFTVTKKILPQSVKRPVIYITGGSLGSHSLNMRVAEILPELLEMATVIHQTGNVKEFRDYFSLLKMHDELPEKKQKEYILREHIADDEIGSVFNLADMVVGRAGANTFSELIILKKPAVLCPLPWSAHDEQKKHAEFFKKNGLGEIYDQYEPANQLLSITTKMLERLPVYRKNFDKVNKRYTQNAVSIVLNEIIKNT